MIAKTVIRNNKGSRLEGLLNSNKVVLVELTLLETARIDEKRRIFTPAEGMPIDAKHESGVNQPFQRAGYAMDASDSERDFMTLQTEMPSREELKMGTADPFAFKINYGAVKSYRILK